MSQLDARLCHRIYENMWRTGKAKCAKPKLAIDGSF